MRRATLVQLAVFVLVAAVSLGYVGTRVFGPFGGGYRVTVRMADAGGLSVGAQVTYRGVPADEVESITLEPSYVRVIFELDGTHPDTGERGGFCRDGQRDPDPAR